MSVMNILQAPWAISPETLAMMWDIYEAHLERGGKLTAEELTEIELATGKKLDGRRLPTVVHDGVAVIPVMGPMIPRANMFQEISGATSYAMIRNDLAQAMEDSSVRSVMLNFDSPGGSVNQLYDLAAFVHRAASAKPIAAWTDGSMTSAAQLLGAAAGATYIGSDAAALGSIGVLGMHRNIAKAEEMRGEKTTLITAGRYKDVGHPYGPLSDEHKAIMQDRLDYLYTSFVDTMAAYRNMDRQKMATEVADARIFTGRQAITAGLADGMMSYDDMVAMMRDRGDTLKRKSTSAPGGSATAEIPNGGESMTRAELKEKHPALHAEVFEEGKQAGLAEGRDQAIASERSRVMGILEIPGPAAQAHRTLLMEGIKEGKNAGDVALAIQHKEADLLAQAGKDIKEGAVPPAPAADPGSHVSADAAQSAAVADAMTQAADAWQKRN